MVNRALAQMRSNPSKTYGHRNGFSKYHRTEFQTFHLPFSKLLVRFDESYNAFDIE